MINVTPECNSVANYIISEINKYNESKLFTEQIFLNTKKLQKLLYFCDVEYMKQYNGIPMFKDEFKAWPSGPAIPEIYCQFVLLGNGQLVNQFCKDTFNITKEAKFVIDSVIEKTKEMDTIDLVKISQIQGGPWSNVYKIDDPNHEQIISKKETFEFYLNIDLFNDVEENEIGPVLTKSKKK